MKLCKLYFDTEFTGLHSETTLISLGIVSETGAWFYAEFIDYDKEQIDEWIEKHVIDNLLFTDDAKFIEINDLEKDTIPINSTVQMKGSIAEIANILNKWIYSQLRITSADKVQFYSDCYAYDWMLMNKLLCKDGLAINLPDEIYYIPIDLSTLLQYSKYQDADYSREEIAKEYVDGPLEESVPSILKREDGKILKHNSLWDAAIIRLCFMNLTQEEK